MSASMLPRTSNARAAVSCAAVISGCLLGALPLAIAVFPQEVKLQASQLEPKFHNIISPTTGQRVQTFVYNKGV
jgi:hypothetical protein